MLHVGKETQDSSIAVYNHELCWISAFPFKVGAAKPIRRGVCRGLVLKHTAHRNLLFQPLYRCSGLLAL